MTAILFQAIYCVWVIFLAYLNKQWIINNMTVRHWANALAHGAAMFQLYRSWGWMPAIALPFLVRIIFDGTLSKFRGLSFWYVSPRPKSFFDKWEKKIFGTNSFIPRLIYLIIFIGLNLTYELLK